VHAANKGVAMTSGDVVAWLNADDRYEPGALRAVAEALAAAPEAAWATGYCRIIDGDGQDKRRFVTEYKKFLLRHYSLGLYVTQNFVSDPATFVRRSALDQVGLLDEHYRMSHDYDLWLRVARLSDPVVLRRYVAGFRMVEGTLSMSGFERQFEEHADCARRRGKDHRIAVVANAVASRTIIAVYRLIRVFTRTRSA
jgi:GT2 family glycosyltransferase